MPKTDKIQRDDNKIISFQYDDGSLCTIDYFSTGHSGISKEYIEIHFDGKSIVMDDYKSIKGYGVSVPDPKAPISPKGHLAELEYLYDTLHTKTNDLPIPLWDIVQTTSASIVISNQ